MHQLEIKYFFPLTEQVDLDLDYTRCNEFEEEKRKEMLASSVLSGQVLISNGGYGLSTWNNLEPNFTIDIDQTPITVTSKTKPSFIKRWIYKIMGIKWKAK